MHVEYRYFSDTWDIKAHTAEIGYSRYFGENWLADSFFRYYTPDARALLQRQRARARRCTSRATAS